MPYIKKTKKPQTKTGARELSGTRTAPANPPPNKMPLTIPNISSFPTRTHICTDSPVLQPPNENHVSNTASHKVTHHASGQCHPKRVRKLLGRRGAAAPSRRRHATRPPAAARPCGQEATGRRRSRSGRNSSPGRRRGRWAPRGAPRRPAAPRGKRRCAGAGAGGACGRRRSSRAAGARAPRT